MPSKKWIITGPTGVGKTSVSIELAKQYKGEIISADSMQIYQEMDIGTAKIKEAEKEGIPHHLIDIVHPLDSFSVAEFKQLANQAIHQIEERGSIPIITGGTGLYLNSLLYDMTFQQTKPDEANRKKWLTMEREKGAKGLYLAIQERDPALAKQIDPNNSKRMIRTLEILSKKGSYHTFDQLKERDPNPEYVVFILERERETLYQHINTRVDQMMQDGLLEEVIQLLEKYPGIEQKQSFQAIGYKQLYRYLDGQLSLEEAVEQIKRDSRRYAKRQFTWFRRYSFAYWIDVKDSSMNQIIHQINQHV